MIEIDESSTPRATRRASRQNPDIPQGPSDLRVGDADGEAVAFVSERKCGLCTFNGVDTEFSTQTEFWAHLKESHPKPTREEFVPCETHCRWICSACGAESWYPVTQEGMHGGPPTRSFDRRFAFGFCREGKYPSHKPAVGLIGNSRGPVIKYHEGVTFSEQPVQDDPSLGPFIKKPERKSSAHSSTKRTGGIRRATRRAA